MQGKLIIAAAVALVCVAALLLDRVRPAPEAAGCGDRGFGWSDSDPPINRRHIFCGEVRGGEPRGFHAVQLKASAPLVRAIENRGRDRDGIYSAVVIFANGRRKFSTFFPDHCTVAEIVQSIDHAASGEAILHPAWGMVGLSAPNEGVEGYCLDRLKRPFSIRFAKGPDGRVNTAFPN
jgi:hypothetical protein